MSTTEEKSTGDYRQYLPDLGIPRFTTMKTQDAHEYAHAFKTKRIPPWLYALFEHWRDLYEEPYQGISTNGTIRQGLFSIQDEGLPVEDIVASVQGLTKLLNKEQRKALSFHIGSPEWRTWSNPELLLVHKGIRLDEVEVPVRDAIMKVLETTLSPEGYDKATKAMRINHYLGELVESPKAMNEFSYNFAIFGRPSTTRPWGWTFYGHHLCLNIFIYKGQIVASPWFTGAEPNEIDSGPYKGTRILQVEETLGIQLMQSLPSEVRQKAQTYKKMNDPEMPLGRTNKDDQRHLCGAYRNNRQIPYEGVLVSDFTSAQKEHVYGILEQYLLYLPKRSRQLKIEQIKKYETETYFSWIGGFENNDPFYYRLQSPVILVEFDHHSGVFLTNEEPKKFHIHTLLRTPNAGDYGYALRPLIPPVESTVAKHITW
ncbi:hypothetical protein EYB26_000336 [Talaromyces marneffei]|uniref:uncharacterized protein n=1 Tax=Talaromyces marneffei TaxID=37727 RepID=UPI0012AA7EA4|nr:uncharacterized protein EYB26_000336 [Talaromyces marneffei]QGA12692.1 hypothetical protein EYB26_000336 [Talaromyces marneffei]